MMGFSDPNHKNGNCIEMHDVKGKISGVSLLREGWSQSLNMCTQENENLGNKEFQQQEVEVRWA